MCVPWCMCGGQKRILWRFGFGLVVVVVCFFLCLLSSLPPVCGIKTSKSGHQMWGASVTLPTELSL